MTRNATAGVASAVLMIALLFLAPATADAEWTTLAGKEAPALELESWLAAPDGKTLRDLRGNVVVLLLEGAVDLQDEKAVTHWNDLRAGWWEKGLRVVALLAKAPDALPAGVEFSVAVGKAPAYGAGAEPRAVLIAADGSVCWEGTPRGVSDEAVAAVLRKARRFHLDVKGAAAKTPAVVAYKKGKLGEARSLAAAQEAPGEECVLVTARVGSLLAYWQQQAKRAAAAGSYDEAGTCLHWIARHFKGAAEATAAQEELAKLKSDKAFSKECSAASAYARLRQDLAGARGKAKKLAALAKKAERSARKKPVTCSVERAARLAERLRADPATSALQAFIKKEKVRASGSQWRNTLPRPPQVEFAKGKTYLWHLQTNKGPITLRFFPDVAPMHVSSAMYLTLLGYYDGLSFHRVIPGFMAQGGCPDGTGSGRFGYEFDGEFDDGVKHDREGLLSAANSGAGTDGPQFFITFGPAKHLDGQHTIYGEVIRGTKALKAMEKLGTEAGPPTGKLTIEKATISVE